MRKHILTAANYKRLREQLGMNQVELARALGVTNELVSRKEKGHTPVRKIDILALGYLNLLKNCGGKK